MTGFDTIFGFKGMSTSNIRSLTGWANPGKVVFVHFERDVPFMAVDAFKMARRDLKIASFDPDGFTAKKGFCDLAVG